MLGLVSTWMGDRRGTLDVVAYIEGRRISRGGPDAVEYYREGSGFITLCSESDTRLQLIQLLLMGTCMHGINWG